MQLCQLAGDDDMLRSSKYRLDILERIQNAMWGFVKDMRYLASCERFECCFPLACFGWEKAVEGELVGRETASNQAADCGTWAGDRKDIDARSNGSSGDLSSGIGNSGRAGIADNGYSS